jgi:acetyl esterase/lipase
MATPAATTLVLEPAAQTLVEATANPPYLFELPPVEGRKALDDLQSAYVVKPDVELEDILIEGGPNGEVDARIVRPLGANGALPVILYVHGAGWVFGDKLTHDRLVRELAVGCNAAVVFPDYRRSPEARYPSAIEESWTAARWVLDFGGTYDLDGARMAVAGDSVGGNMSIALTLLAKERGTVDFCAQLLFYPVTDAAFDTPSYHEFAEGFYLRRDGMQWFWDQYTTDEAERAQITASPLRATTEQLMGLPKALVITAEADVLRDEGEAYAAKLRRAAVDVTAVRYEGVVHDFVMLDSLRRTNAAGAAIAQASAFLRDALHPTTAGPA